MRIAIPAYDVNRAGGTQRYIWYVAEHLAGLGHEVDVLTTSGPGVDIPYTCRMIAVRGGRLPVTALGVADMLSFPFRVRRLLDTQRYDVLYGPMGALLKPGVVTAAAVHASWVHDRAGRRSLFDRGACLVERRTATMPATRWTAVSPLCADQLSRFYGLERKRIGVVPPGVDLGAFPLVSPDSRRASRGVLGIRESRFVVGTVANYNFQNKGVGELILAAGRAGAFLLIAGVDSRQPEMESIAARVGADVRFLGRVPELSSFLHALDVFALPSHAESYGMAAHEAMAVGVPTVISRQCGIAELLDPTAAVLVERRDHAGLAEALQSLRDPDLAQRAADAGALWARARTWQKTGAAIAAEIELWAAANLTR